MSVDVVSVIARALSFIALFQVIGTALFAVCVRRQIVATSRAELRTLLNVSAPAALVFLAVHFLLEAGRFAGDWSGVFDVELQQLVLHSSFAAAAALRGVAVTVIWWGLARGSGASRALLPSVLACALSFALVGHTREADASVWMSLLLVVHVIIAAFWFGSFIPLLQATRHHSADYAARIVDRFSRVAVVFVPVLLLAGLLLAWAIAGSWSMVNRPYGQLLFLKFLLFALVMILAALNRWRFAPALARRGQSRALRVSIALEMALIAGVLAATATLTSLYSPDV